MLGLLRLLQSFKCALLSLTQSLHLILCDSLFLFLRRWHIVGHSIYPPSGRRNRVALLLTFGLLRYSVPQRSLHLINELITHNNAKIKLFLHALIFTIHLTFEIAETFQPGILPGTIQSLCRNQSPGISVWNQK